MDCCILCLTQVPNAPEVTKMNFPSTEDIEAITHTEGSGMAAIALEVLGGKFLDRLVTVC